MEKKKDKNANDNSNKESSKNKQNIMQNPNSITNLIGEIKRNNVLKDRNFNLLHFDDSQLKTILANTAYLFGFTLVKDEIKPAMCKMFSDKFSTANPLDKTDYILPNMGNNFIYEVKENIQGMELMRRIEGMFNMEFGYKDYITEFFDMIGYGIGISGGGGDEKSSMNNNFLRQQYYMESYQTISGQILYDQIRIPNENFLYFFKSNEEITMKKIKLFHETFGTHAVARATIGAAHYRYMDTKSFDKIKNDYLSKSFEITYEGLLVQSEVSGKKAQENMKKYFELVRNFKTTCRGGLDESDRIAWLDTISYRNLKIIKIDKLVPIYEYLNEPQKQNIIDFIEENVNLKNKMNKISLNNSDGQFSDKIFQLHSHPLYFTHKPSKDKMCPVCLQKIGKSNLNFSFACKKCKYEACYDCYMKNSQRFPKNTDEQWAEFIHPHPLYLMHRNFFYIYWHCAFCKTKYMTSREQSYCCEACSLDVCTKCLDTLKNSDEQHIHILSVVNKKMPKFICSKCNTAKDVDCICACNECNIEMCLECAYASN